jgi:uncharacterized membrane protein YraQ (UPF0718 family)
VQGLVIGTPLGVCVNCAAPIGQAMLKAGSPVEVALGAMFASPSFNVIVLGMVLTLFPWYLAALKVAMSLVMVLLVVPQLSRLAERPGWRRQVESTPRLPGLRLFQWTESLLGSVSRSFLTPAGDAPKGFLPALGWVLLRYTRNLWTVIRISLPLMVVAGLLGAAMVELLPWTRVAQIAQVDGLLPNAAVLVLVAVFGTLLPVPIAFDVVVCAVLWNAGVPTYVVATLLVTLALYSVYPWSLLGTTLSWRVAAVAGAAVMTLGIVAGGGGGARLPLAGPPDDPACGERARQPSGTSSADGLPAPGPECGRAAGARAAAPGADADRRRPGASSSGVPPSPGRRRGVRQGVHPDRGRTDRPRSPAHAAALPGHAARPDAHRRVGGGRRQRRWLAGPGGRHELRGAPLRERRRALRAAGGGLPGDARLDDLASSRSEDLDGDGALDLFFCTWMHGCHVSSTARAGSPARPHSELPRFQETAVTAVAFADVDRDGWLDVVHRREHLAATLLLPVAGGEPALAQRRRGSSPPRLSGPGG